MERNMCDDRSMAINFCFDHMTSPGRLGYPNLARLGLQGHEFDDQWPRTLPLRLLVYFDQSGIPNNSFTVQDAPQGSWYPVALAWHDFDCDYISLMSSTVVSRVRNREIRVLFYYHEGDHPGRIQSRLDFLCQQHDLPLTYLLISANTSADHYSRCCYFPDHELFFRYVNRRQPTPTISLGPKPYEFTVLNRTHKWWRASVMSDLDRHGLLNQSLWSYNTDCGIDDPWQQNPLSVMADDDWSHHLQRFMAAGSRYCDDLGKDLHNDHRSVNVSLYQDSYCHVVIETLFDVDQSEGAFLTEKTYKCIKFGQPFVTAGGPGSIAALRSAGYRVFDHAIDHRYDTIQDNNQRWRALREEITRLRSLDMQAWFESCYSDLRHNQDQYAEPLLPSLQGLIHRLESN